MLRQRIESYYGGCDILATERTARGEAFWFVVDTVARARPLRTLGSIDRHGAVMEQSAMDLLRPERLVFFYERLMLTAFALVPEPRKALLLGLGGGAMSRHLAAYLPDCVPAIVERDHGIIALARRYFRLVSPVVEADAEAVVADSAGAFDVVLVDLYDPRGLVPVQRSFWRDCVAALRPGGCLAINWAGFLNRRPIREQIAEAGADLGRSVFLIDRGPRPNMVQLVPTDAAVRWADVPARLAAFGRTHRLPAEDRSPLKRCRILARFPVDAAP